MGMCQLCTDEVPDPELVEHLRLMHPDQYEPPQTWPDGGLVITDTTDPTPEDLA